VQKPNIVDSLLEVCYRFCGQGLKYISFDFAADLKESNHAPSETLQEYLRTCAWPGID
jgi:hypothetical protein